MHCHEHAVNAADSNDREAAPIRALARGAQRWPKKGPEDPGLAGCSYSFTRGSPMMLLPALGEAKLAKIDTSAVLATTASPLGS